MKQRKIEHNKKAFRLLGLSILNRLDTFLRTIEDIRAATNKAWVLGNEFFKAQIEQKTGRPSQARKVGGDIRSEEYRRLI